MIDTKSTYLVSGIAAFLFSCTGPVAIIFSVARASGLSDAHIASWLFGGFAISSLFTLYFCLKYRQPIAFAWTIPGTVLLLSALDHLQFNEVVGAYMVTALLIFVLGITGSVRKVMAWIPTPVIMAMVAGVFLDFGLGIVYAFNSSISIALSMVVGFVIVSMMPGLQRVIPPILAALIIGAISVWGTDSFNPTSTQAGLISAPILFIPVFSVDAILELVVPLTITVLIVQNAQGIAVVTAAGHKPPVNAMTTACGIGSVFLGLVGSVTMCVTGPSNAILSASGQPEKQYQAGVTYAVLGIAFGVFGALMTWLVLKLPAAYIAVLGGLAVFKVLQNAFTAAFTAGHVSAALVTFLVTVSDIQIWNIGAPFWGLVFGLTIDKLLPKGI